MCVCYTPTLFKLSILNVPSSRCASLRYCFALFPFELEKEKKRKHIICDAQVGRREGGDTDGGKRLRDGFFCKKKRGGKHKKRKQKKVVKGGREVKEVERKRRKRFINRERETVLLSPLFFLTHRIVSYYFRIFIQNLCITHCFCEGR